MPILAFSNEFIKSDTKAQNTKLDAIVVSSTGFENTLKNELKNIHIITSDDIKQQGYKNIQDIDIRSQGNKANTSVKVLLNGIPLNLLDSSHFAIPLDLIDIADVERIELIAGEGACFMEVGQAVAW